MTIHNELPIIPSGPDILWTQVLTAYEPGVEQVPDPNYHPEMAYRYVSLEPDANAAYDCVFAFRDSPQAYPRQRWDEELDGGWQSAMRIEQPIDGLAIEDKRSEFVRQWQGPLIKEDQDRETEIADLLKLNSDELDDRYIAAYCDFMAAGNPAVAPETRVVGEVVARAAESAIMLHAEPVSENTGIVDVNEYLFDDDDAQTPKIQELRITSLLDNPEYRSSSAQEGSPVETTAALDLVAAMAERPRHRRMMALATGIAMVALAGAALFDAHHNSTVASRQQASISAHRLHPSQGPQIEVPTIGTATPSPSTATKAPSVEPVAAVQPIPQESYTAATTTPSQSIRATATGHEAMPTSGEPTTPDNSPTTTNSGSPTPTSSSTGSPSPTEGTPTVPPSSSESSSPTATTVSTEAGTNESPSFLPTSSAS